MREATGSRGVARPARILALTWPSATTPTTPPCASSTTGSWSKPCSCIMDTASAHAIEGGTVIGVGSSSSPICRASHHSAGRTAAPPPAAAAAAASAPRPDDPLASSEAGSRPWSTIHSSSRNWDVELGLGLGLGLGLELGLIGLGLGLRLAHLGHVVAHIVGQQHHAALARAEGAGCLQRRRHRRAARAAHQQALLLDEAARL
eukprot:scaffold43867_cov34-Phaeocystis_antarctica.AAC.1